MSEGFTIQMRFIFILLYKARVAVFSCLFIEYFPLNSIRSNDSQMTDASDCDDKPVRLYYLLGENLLIFPCVLFGTYLFVNFHI